MASTVHFKIVNRDVFPSRQGLARDLSDGTVCELQPGSEVAREAPYLFVVDASLADPAYEHDVRFRKFANVTIAPEFVVVLPKGQIVTPGFFVADKHGHLLADSFRAHGLLSRNGFREPSPRELEIDLGPPRATLPGLCLPVGTQNNRNYFHWLFESLPRLLTAQKVHAGPMTVCVPPLQEWMRAMLVSLCPEKWSVHEMQGDLTIVDRLLFASRGLRSISTFNANAIEMIDRLLAGVERRGCAPSRRLFVSRQRTNNRRLSNESQLRTIAEGRGFEVVMPECLPFREQIELFADAKAVIGPLGAGMCNIAFMPPHGCVLELAPDGRDGDATLFANLSHLRRLAYGCIVGRRALEFSKPAHIADFTIDPLVFEAALDKLPL